MLSVPSLPRKLLTLAFIVRESASNSSSSQVLLGMKKRGFGRGKWNGFGGKVEAADHSIVAATAREIQEEANVAVQEKDLQPRGVLLFSFEEAKEVMEVHVFLTHKFSGEPSESEEMKPQWYDVEEIPFKDMWADDSFWLPHVLNGKSVQGHFRFAADENTLLDHELEVTSAAQSKNLDGNF
ncbi:Nudix (Nucleoside diphosphate linked moiety X)-type motif 1 [Phytophthora boehmeriae]|uniref:Nudix (Nucleoside diphosphate linked moiety X)-type motif 1 n=1 Tax=Phytophthora boehmeriae TaxID=109152 RepID=A0A8T1VSJ0_9STRA|nr:Nudix (Nucleoside diphosphate linked moiety X)-type motif 1 [Phytophthora boehmeriae]